MTELTARSRRARSRGVLPVAVLSTVLGVSSAAAQAQPAAIVEGGADPSGHNYEWTITNRSNAPITYVAFPHYRAVLFFTPEGWSTESTYMGVRTRPGVCTARAREPGAGIAPGDSATFRMQIAPAGAWRGRGAITIGFASGGRRRIFGVELPQEPPGGAKYTSLVGLGAIFVVFLLVQVARRRWWRKAPA